MSQTERWDSRSKEKGELLETKYISVHYEVNYIKNNNEVSLKFVYDSNSV